MRKTLSVALLLISVVVLPLGWAQVPASSGQLSAAQREAMAKQDEHMEAAARRVAGLIDNGRAGEIWDGSSGITQKAVGRPVFVEGVGRDRQQLGAVVNRGPASVSRVQYPGGAAVPAGLYLNVSFATRFANAEQPVRELVSFRLDDDRVWRVSGYSVRSVNQ